MDDRSQLVRAALTTAGLVPGEVANGASAAQAWAGVLEVVAGELAGACGEPGQWAESARSAVVDVIDRATRVLGAARAPLLVAQQEAGLWRRPGVRSFEAYRAAKNREDVGAARREAATARTLTELDGGVEALARGEITPSHAERLRAVADKVDPQVRTELLTGHGAAMVRDLARQHEPKVFARKVEQLAARRHPATVQDAHEAIRAKRFLRILPGPGGTRIEGLLDPVAGHRFQLAIEAASPRPAQDDTRTLGQRNADALQAITGAILTEGDLAPAKHVPTQVMITMTEHTFLTAQTHLAAATHTGAGDGHEVGQFPVIRAQDGPLLPPADLGRLLCGSAVGRMVVSAESVPLNVGRSQRTFKNHQRRAVELRDQHCAWPTCTQVARYCEVHHLDHWVADHGETDVARAVLVCSFHHHELHRHDLDLTTPDPLPDEAEAGPPGPRPLPGDPDYHPPTYQLVPRTRTAHERRQRLLQRARTTTRPTTTAGTTDAPTTRASSVSRTDTASPTAAATASRTDAAGPSRADTARGRVRTSATGERPRSSPPPPTGPAPRHDSGDRRNDNDKRRDGDKWGPHTRREIERQQGRPDAG